MAEVLLHHHIQGLTDGIRAFAEELRAAGHTVHTPDLFEGQVFADIPAGFGYAREVGLDVVRRRGLDAAAELPAEIVHAGFSFGVTIAQQLAQTHPGARGAVFIDSCLPVSEFGPWPDGVPVQIHGMEHDEFFEEDLPAARELEAVAGAELFVYPGDTHLFADASLPAYDPRAAAALRGRVLTFLAQL